MTDHHDQPKDPFWEGMRIQKENAQKRQEWEAARERERDQARREAMQEELAAYLRRRGTAWQDATGSSPSRGILERWTEDFLNEKQLEAQAERQAKIDEGSAI